MTFDPDHGAPTQRHLPGGVGAGTACGRWRPGPSKATAPSTGGRRLWRWALAHPARGAVLYLSDGRADRRGHRRRSAVRTAQRGAGRKPGGRHGGRARHPRGRCPHLDADAAVLHAGRHPRQHAELPARHHGGAGPLLDRADGPARPHPRLEPDRPRPRAGARLPERAAQHLDLAAQRVALAVGHLGAEVSRRPRQADRLQQAAGRRPGGVRAPRRQPAGAARPHRQRPRLRFGGHRPAHHRAGGQPVRHDGPTTSSISTRAGSTPTTCCCASSARTSRASSARRA